ncbi:serine/threonine-protein kinase [Saccharomonospora sp. NPDC046836]|uniref:serine/threonine-protein kinase n=1 Tax=Saccharomonospora sp. NPDC046836 TaxID=3156921 RepID=UPI0033C1AC91
MGDGEGRLVAGRYRLQSRIGSGAMGVVWRAVDDRLDRTVAVKQLLLPPGLNEDETEKARQRAFREGRIAARLQHPNAISVYNVADDGGQPVLVMEYLPSHSLSAVLQERGVLPPAEAARIGAQVALALTAAHAAGVIHRDVKPGNILLGADGTTKITDFGISRAAGDITVTSTGLLAGTPAFLSPEAARGAEPGSASDVFSLGATLYAAVEGRPPFGDAGNEIALLHTVATGQTIPPRQAGVLTTTLQAMLRTEPAERPTMVQVAEALQALTEGRAPVAADPPTLPATAAVAPPRRSATRLDLHPAAAPPLPPRPLPPAPAPGYPAQAGGERSNRTRILISALAVLAAAVVGILVAELLVGVSRNDSGAAQTTTPAATTSAPPSSPPTSSSTSTVQTTTAVQGTAPEELEQAVADYYALLPDDTDEAWDGLGPGLQGQGQKRYERFWKDVDAVSVVQPPRVQDDQMVEVTLEFTMDGGDVIREVHQLGMVVVNGRPLIDSDQLVSSREVRSDRQRGRDGESDDDG